MDTLFLYLKKVVDNYDRQLASDYVSYYGIDSTEYAEYADEFVKVCYEYNEQTGEHEPRRIDELPFANVTYTDNGLVIYEYGNCKITKPDNKKYF